MIELYFSIIQKAYDYGNIGNYAKFIICVKSAKSIHKKFICQYKIFGFIYPNDIFVQYLLKFVVEGLKSGTFFWFFIPTFSHHVIDITWTIFGLFHSQRILKEYQKVFDRKRRIWWLSQCKHFPKKNTKRPPKNETIYSFSTSLRLYVKRKRSTIKCQMCETPWRKTLSINVISSLTKSFIENNFFKYFQEGRSLTFQDI